MGDNWEGSINDEKFNEEANKLIRKSTKKIKKEEGWQIASNNEYKNKLVNVVKFMNSDNNLKDVFRFNSFVEEIEFNKTPIWDPYTKEGKLISDGDEVSIKGYLMDKYKFEPTISLIKEAIYLTSMSRKTHPIKDYLEPLKWDGEKRLDNWLPHVASTDDNAYTRAVGRKLICAMIARIYKPGCQFDHMSILEGAQGIYKTTMLKILGGKWYAPLMNIEKTADAVDTMRGKWLLEMEELEAIRNTSDVAHMRAFISRTTDRVRLSYRRNVQDFGRRCVFVGTMNPIGDNQYFRDMAGNRRFWPIECKKQLNIKWLRDNKDQIFAEAMTCWEEEPLYLNDEKSSSIALEMQEERKSQDGWTEIIEKNIGRKDVVTPVEIAHLLGISNDRINNSTIVRIGQCMKSLGWERIRYGRKKHTTYIKPGISLANALDNISERWDD